MIINSQNKHSLPLEGKIQIGGIWVTEKDKLIHIPFQDKRLKTILMVIAHFGLQGHRGVSAIIDTISKRFDWKQMNKDVKQFIKGCLICKLAKTPSIIRQPLGDLNRASAPNQIIYFDYAYIGDSNDGENYLLVLRDDLSHFIELTVAPAPTADIAVSAILQWISRYGVPQEFRSDGGTHFRNEVMKDLFSQLSCQHYVTTPYCAWSNLAERTIKELRILFRTTTMELKLEHDRWTEIVSFVQFCFNQKPTANLNHKAPMTIFIGRNSDDLLPPVFSKKDKKLISASKDLTELVISHIQKI